MRKIKTKEDMRIDGWGFIPKGTEYKGYKYNKRFVYVELNKGVRLRLSRKGDCEEVY